MIVKNEQKYLERCLNSVKNIVDEIIIVDTGSTDDTKVIASSFQAKIYDYQWIDDFSVARNFALLQSTGDWNLILDADEYIVNDCNVDIVDFINNENNQNIIGRIKIVNKFVQNSEIRYSEAFVSRLIPKGIGYTGRIHEQIESDFVRKNINVEVFHDGYFEKDKTQRNLSILLKELEEKPYDDYILYQVGKQYQLKKRLQESEKYFGESNKLIASDSWYRPSLIVDYLYVIINNKSFAKGLRIIHQEQERLADMPDFHFVCGLFYMELVFYNIKQYGHLFKNIEKSFLNCLAIGETSEYDSVKGTGSFLASYNLGVYYETTGDIKKGIYYYQNASQYQYEPAIDRLRRLVKSNID